MENLLTLHINQDIRASFTNAINSYPGIDTSSYTQTLWDEIT